MGLETKYYVDAEGTYVGGFSAGNPAIPQGSIEVDSPPPHGWQKYVNGAWLPLTDEQKALLGI